MAQYTNTFTSPFDGTVTNAVLDSVTNKTTITVTAPGGQTASVTVDSDLANLNGPYAYNIDFLVSNLSRQLNEQGADLGLRGITGGVTNTTNSVNQQLQTATGVALATGNPPPAESQAIPTNSTVDPAVPPAAPAPETETPTSQKNADTEQQIEETTYEPLATPPGTDEYDGLETQIAANENALQEPPLLTDEEIAQAYPPPPDEYVAPTEQDVVAAAGGWQGLQNSINNTRAQATEQDQANFKQKEDWRVRLSLAPNSNYLYNAPTPGILKPLQATDGILFPYTPQVSVNYAATYDSSDLTHSNYKIFQYKNSSVDQVSITCDFTAQDTFEANYLLAVIHFLRSVTKMFYGQDQNPKPGTPPPLCYLSGLGAFQFDAHPLAITAFNYSLPNDVDYIRATNATTIAGVNRSSDQTPNNSDSLKNIRMAAANLTNGSYPANPQWNNPPAGTISPTYVPTKIQIQISAVPIVTRNDISNKFSLKDYATGQLLRGTQRAGGGIW